MPSINLQGSSRRVPAGDVHGGKHQRDCRQRLEHVRGRFSAVVRGRVMARPDAKIEYPSREAVAEFVLRVNDSAVLPVRRREGRP